MLFLLAINKIPRGAVLTIVDGMGESAWTQGNGIEKAKTPNMDYLKSHHPYESLVAAQQPVGLIRGEPGSSSVGHQTIGLGRSTPSYFQQLERAMNPDTEHYLGKNPVFLKTIRHAKEGNGRVHFAGLCTDVGIFSHVKFFEPMFETAKRENVSEILVHCFFTDMDSEPKKFIPWVERLFPEGIKAKIASVHTRYTALDKFNNWEMSNKTAQAIALGKGKVITRSMLFSTAKGYKDVTPLIIGEPEENRLRENDSLILIQHREDQSYQVAKLLFHGGFTPKNVMITPMVLYDKSLKEFEPILPQVTYNNSLGSWISQKGFKQIRIAEEYKKYHITAFLSGGVNQPRFKGETDVINFTSVPESIVEFHPEMNASNVFNAFQNAIKSEQYKFIAVNYGNIDATGHTGNTTAVTMACEFVDSLIGKMIKLCHDHDYVLFVTADHGNGEEDESLDGTKTIDHTVNNVPFMTTIDEARVKRTTLGKVHFIGNVAATVLKSIGIEPPPEMEPSIFDFDYNDPDTKEEVVINTNTTVTFLLGLIAGVLISVLGTLVFNCLLGKRRNMLRSPGLPLVNA